MRLIDADKLKEDMRGTNMLFSVTDVIDRQPTVDAVEIIRCNDCKYRLKDGNARYYCQNERISHDLYHDVKDTDYCSFAERKEE